MLEKSDKIKFFDSRVVSSFFTLISFFAIFSFWSDMKDFEKIACILIISFIAFIANIGIYYMNVKKFYAIYEKLHINNQGLINNFDDVKQELTQEKYNNSILREFSQRTINLMVMYNEFDVEERKDIREKIVNDFFDKDLKGGNDDE